MSDSYALLDCGDGRRLERFGSLVVDRPAPAAVFSACLDREAWERADLRFDRDGGWRGEAPADWRVRFGRATLFLRTAAGGQIGVFPEHDGVCGRLERMLADSDPPAGGWRVLHLFAHTGLATLRLASLPAMGEIVHLDASPAALRQARENAAVSGLAEAPIRWLEDDALGFLARENRRGRKYHLVIADPPAFGRSRKGGKEWKLERDLPELLRLAGAAACDGGNLCLTCHPSGWPEDRLARIVGAALPGGMIVENSAVRLIPASGGRALPCGRVVRFCFPCRQGNHGKGR